MTAAPQVLRLGHKSHVPSVIQWHNSRLLDIVAETTGRTRHACIQSSTHAVMHALSHASSQNISACTHECMTELRDVAPLSSSMLEASKSTMLSRSLSVGWASILMGLWVLRMHSTTRLKGCRKCFAISCGVGCLCSFCSWSHS